MKLLGYQSIYISVLKLLSTHDLKKSAELLHLQLSPNKSIILNFLDREYEISNNTIDLIGQRVPWTDNSTDGFEYNLKSALGYYIMSNFDQEPGHDLCPLSFFSNGRFKNDAFNFKDLDTIFGNNYPKFAKTVTDIGFQFEGEQSKQQYVWDYLLLPKLPVKIIYFSGDDEFPTKIHFLYDKTAVSVARGHDPLVFLHYGFTVGLSGLAV
ncbi:MAG: DUF3786 domain-containing protein [Deltaproteobacteria bacterium]|jgi:hypothetical protein|nr:DUF3786 domain-containing protein [Deltaproteobacteria bacterium]